MPCRLLTHGRTDGHTDRVTTVGTLSGFQDFILQPIIKDRPNISQFQRTMKFWQSEYFQTKIDITFFSIFFPDYFVKFFFSNNFSRIGPILDDRLKEKILKPWKGAHSSHSVCPSVCLCVNTLQDTLFGLETQFLGWMILGTWKKTKNAYKKRKNENFKKQKNAFFSHVPRIIQPKN